MEDKVEALKALQARIQGVRAILPEVLQKLAYADDNDDSVQLFKDVSQGLHDWRSKSLQIDAQYTEMKPLIDELNAKGR